MKYLIVNGDDFGASPGINRGIIEAHRRGILTSTSLLVHTAWSAQAAELSRSRPELSVGLHLDLDTLAAQSNAESSPMRSVRDEIRGQVDRFHKLVGTTPTHLDTHHNTHRDPRLLPWVLEAAAELCAPVREHSPARYFARFYGQWAGQSHLEQVSLDNFVRILQTQLHDGITELGCHPGYADEHLRSSYSIEREAELRTLCDPRAAEAVAAENIRLVSFRHVRALLPSQPVPKPVV